VSGMAKLGLGVVVLMAVWKLALAPSQIQADVAYPLQYRTQVVGGANSGDSLPLVIALHGSGADENDLNGVFANFKTPVRVVSFRGPERGGSGYVWAVGQGANQAEARAAQAQMFQEVAESIAAGADEVAARYPTQGKPVVFGFSRGASLAWFLGARHPEHFDAIFAVAGNLDVKLLQGLYPAARPPFFAYHGKRDNVIPFRQGQQTAEAVQALGARVRFESFEDGHTIPAGTIDDVDRQIARLYGL